MNNVLPGLPSQRLADLTQTVARSHFVFVAGSWPLLEDDRQHGLDALDARATGNPLAEKSAHRIRSR